MGRMVKRAILTELTEDARHWHRRGCNCNGKNFSSIGCVAEVPWLQFQPSAGTMGHYWLMITPVPLPVPNTLNLVGLLQVCNISSVAAAEVRRLLQDVNNMVTIASFGDGLWI